MNLRLRARTLLFTLLITTLSIPLPPLHAADICWLTQPPIASPTPAAAEEPNNIEVWFSPGDRIRDRLIAGINHTRKTLDAALYELTSPDIAYALVTAHERGVAVRLVVDAGTATHDRHSEVLFLEQHNIPIRRVTGKGRGIMHHKFAIFDHAVAVTGSYNWTESAERFNHENLIILHDPTVIMRLSSQFQTLACGPGPSAPLPGCE